MKKARTTDAIGVLAWWITFIVGSIELKHITPIYSRGFWVLTLVFIALTIIAYMRGTLLHKVKDEEAKEENGAMDQEDPMA